MPWSVFATIATGYCWYQAITYTTGSPWARASSTCSPEAIENCRVVGRHQLDAVRLQAVVELQVDPGLLEIAFFHGHVQRGELDVGDVPHRQAHRGQGLGGAPG